jgi:hypothetical protein
VQCTVRAEDDLLIGRLAANLAGAARVDLSICDEHGVEQQRLRDIPVPQGASSIAVQESITFAKAAGSHTAIMRLIAFDEAGRERPLGEYTFHHTRTLPGPGV